MKEEEEGEVVDGGSEFVRVSNLFRQGRMEAVEKENMLLTATNAGQSILYKYLYPE